MPDYQKMYFCLFNRLTDVIDELQRIQRETEELYIQEKDNISILKLKSKKKNNPDKK